MSDIEPTETVDATNQARQSQIEAEMRADQENKETRQRQTGSEGGCPGGADPGYVTINTVGDSFPTSSGKQPLTGLQKTILKQHRDQINEIDAESTQKLAHLEEIYRRETRRIENAQTKLTAEANSLKDRFVNEGFTPIFTKGYILNASSQSFEAVQDMSKLTLAKDLSAARQKYESALKSAHKSQFVKNRSDFDSVRFSLPSNPVSNSTCFMTEDLTPPRLTASGSDSASASGNDDGEERQKKPKYKKKAHKRAPDHVKKPNMFSGVKEDFIFWKGSFRHYARIMGIKDNEVIEVMCSYLHPKEYRKVEGLCLSEAEKLCPEVAFARIDEVLAKPFSTIGTRIQLNNLRQGTDSVTKFAEHVREMVLKSDYSPEMHNDICLQTFLGGLENDMDAVSILEKNPPVNNFEAAVREIIRRSLARKARAATRQNLNQQNLQQEIFAIKESAEVAMASQQQMFEKMKVEIAQLKEELRSEENEGTDMHQNFQYPQESTENR